MFFFLLIFIMMPLRISGIYIFDMEGKEKIGEIRVGNTFNAKQLKENILQENLDIDDFQFSMVQDFEIPAGKFSVPSMSSNCSVLYDSREDARSMPFVAENCLRICFFFHHIQSDKPSKLHAKIFVDDQEVSICYRQMKFEDYKSRYFILISDINKAIGKLIAVEKNSNVSYTELSDQEKQNIENSQLKIKINCHDPSNIFWFQRETLFNDSFHFYTKQFLLGPTRDPEETENLHPDPQNNLNPKSDFQLITFKSFGIALFLCVCGYVVYCKFVKKGSS